MTAIKEIPVGQLKSKATVQCTVCRCSYTRNLKAFIFDNTKEEIEKAKAELTAKANKEYTCRICKSIKNGN